ncbi:23S rRNA (guanine(745)-N(1))-methyltransferase [Novipirellula galeiformis]|uniref:23S rRNA (Guanine(745)-N(1))-methyltransferase n=1 Tax=Novipirellula galeiformis TaxID=2528004 RepID=A0A5C6C9Z3_9BACT|nr:methyltransferase domain-containing protein [Novipirellula galeiformis]TWU20311.1 23S rRNA (guanine(745)-N(1))-methyltransferase [Novipirellula galeiformis]
MFELRCTVRDCQEPLHQRENGLFCAAGHHFDRAKEGYWSLLQPQDRKSRNPGDADAAVLARHRWLKRGHAAGLIETLQPWITDQQRIDAEVPLRTLDLGCGEGSFGPALFTADADGYCGIDLSKRAIKLAARGWPSATWVLANADRILPAADASVDRVISLFGRRPVQEISRVLAPQGTCIIAVPGEEDLIELREQVQQAGHRRSRWEIIVEEMTSSGLQCDARKHWQQQVELEPDAIADALAMTYRGMRHSQQTRMESLAAMKVTLAADLLLLRRCP